MTEVDLGFIEERESSWLVNRYFPSKIGGKPAWLNLQNLPHPKDLECPNCKSPKAFLCQIYASFETDDTFHRSIYVFYCRSKECQKPNENFMISVFRSQLPLENKFYSVDPPDETGNPLPEIEPLQALCQACGCYGPSHCSACKKAHYCSRAHQVKHHKIHRKQCSNSDNNQVITQKGSTMPEICLPEFEIVIERFPQEATQEDEEEEDNESLSSKSSKGNSVESKSTNAQKASGLDLEIEKEQMALYEKLKAEGKTGTLDEVSETELSKYAGMEASSLDDKHFKTFKKAISKEPDQVIRYDRGGKPLWITNPEETIKSYLDIPKCEYCEEASQFEFHIMPQMLNNLNHVDIDWGLIAIYWKPFHFEET